jgi:hypothetical protein
MTQPPAARTDPAAHDEDFFIGWLPIPPSTRRFLRPAVIVLLLTVAVAAIVVALSQHNPGAGEWNTDSASTFDGMVTATPYAMMRVAGERPGDPPRTILLVEEGKFGARPRVERLLAGNPAGWRAVRASGTVLHRDSRWMLELAEGEGSLQALTPAEKFPGLAAPPAEVLSVQTTLTGEIIDPKCYLGAMKPGGGKTHKACAALCIAGGIPPMFVTRDTNRQETYHLLTTADGGPANEAVQPFVGDSVNVTGRLERHGDMLFLRLVSDGVQRR